ncbi:MAG: RNA polymerase sigma factor [Pirellulaceae bacterium]|nr:MAG: RNA polymerase sigma factor [Pirellulaceae bacterium]
MSREETQPDTHQNAINGSAGGPTGEEVPWDRWVRDSLLGDDQAQAALYSHCHPMVYRLVRRMAGSECADDLTQQVFLQAFRKLDQYRGQAKFHTWLYRLAVNEVLQWVRRRRSPVGPLLADPPEPKAGVAARVEQRDMLDWALKQLDPELRAVFLLKEQHGQSYREIAEAVGIPEGTVGSRMNRARQQLRNLLTLAGWEG